MNIQTHSANPLLSRLAREVSDRSSSGLLRTTAIPFRSGKGNGGLIDCAGNSYLCLHENADILAAAMDLLDGNLSGNTASRLVASRSALFDTLESDIAAWKNTEAALLFNGGYAANIGILQAFCNRDTAVFCDRLNHASMYDGIRLSGAKLSRYRHCDIDDLATRLAGSKEKEKLIVTDAVFSMDGDAAPLERICDLAEQYGALVMVDEAHAAGIFGARASGLCEALGVEDRVAIRMGTLSKALGGFGGFFAGTNLLREHLVNHARSGIYATALPHAVLAWNSAALHYVREHPFAGAALLKTADDLRRKIAALGYNTLGSTTQIVPVLCESAEAALDLCAHLKSRGIAAPAIRPPTVPAGTARVRLSLHSGLSPENLDTLVAALGSWDGRGKTGSAG